MQPKNLLIIMSDEHSVKAMSGNGHDIVKTPNLDKLAARGTKFNAAYCSSPICVPTRASFATGRYVHENGSWCNGHPYTGEMEGWGHRLQETGNRVVSIGKLHYRNETDPTGFEEQIVPLHVVNGTGYVLGAVRDKLPIRRKGINMLNNTGPGESGYIDYDRQIVEESAKWLQERGKAKDDKPWVVFVSMVCPHFPLIAPPEFYEMYDPATIPLSKGIRDEGFTRHPWVDALKRCQNFGDCDDEMKWKIAMASYFGLCSYLDDNVGKVLAALKESGLEGDTRVIYTSDHGDNIGAREMWGKSNMYQESAAIPLIMAGPDVPVGVERETPVSHVDFYQTIMECVGETSVEKDLPGHSLFDLATKDDDEERCVFSEYHASGSPTGGFMLRQGRFKLIYYVSFEPELFDLENDPEEMTNLATDPAHAKVFENLERELRKIIDPEDVDHRAKADQAALVERHGGRDAVVAKGSFGGTPAPGEKPQYA
ncbi:MAG: sulfatase-like hydrolase/transferase [Rhodospirillales bacterium]